MWRAEKVAGNGSRKRRKEMRKMKRAIAAYTAFALTIGLAAGWPAPTAGQTLEADELARVPSRAYDLDVEIWTAKGEAATYAEGQEVKIRFRASSDCYVVIYDIDTEGFLHLLFPDDPYEDGFVEGGRIYSLPNSGVGYTLLAEGPPGIEYVAAVASYYPIAGQLPWYLDDAYENAGYREQYDLEATVDEVGAVRGDPFVAMRDIAYDILPERCAEGDYDADYTYFNVSRTFDHPRYVCYDCHGRTSWLDPYEDVCTVVDIRLDLDWHFVRHPVSCYVGPRFWYWRRHDCPPIYVSLPQFWCSLYPRNLFASYFYLGINRVGLWHEGRGYMPPAARYHGRPRTRGESYTGGYPDRPGHDKDPRNGPAVKGPVSPRDRTQYSRGKPPDGNKVEIREPQRFSKPADGGGLDPVKSRTVGRGSAGPVEKDPGQREKDLGGLTQVIPREVDVDRRGTQAKGIEPGDSGGGVVSRTPKVDDPPRPKVTVVKRGAVSRIETKHKEVKPQPKLQSEAKAGSKTESGKAAPKAKAAKSGESGGTKSQASAPKKVEEGRSKTTAKASKTKAESQAKSKPKTEAAKSAKATSGGDKSRSSSRGSRKK
jgi:hypothetical protein